MKKKEKNKPLKSTIITGVVSAVSVAIVMGVFTSFSEKVMVYFTQPKLHKEIESQYKRVSDSVKIVNKKVIDETENRKSATKSIYKKMEENHEELRQENKEIKGALWKIIDKLSN